MKLSKRLKNIGKEVIKVVLVASLFFGVWQVVWNNEAVLAVNVLDLPDTSLSIRDTGIGSNEWLDIVEKWDKSIAGKILGYVKYLVGTVTILIIIYSAIKLIIADGEEAEVEKTKMTLIYAVMGLFLLVLYTVIVNIFFSSSWVKTALETVKKSLTTDVINVLMVIIRYLGTVVASLFIIISAVRMVLADGDEGVYEKAQKQIIYAVAGLIVIILADDVVGWVYTSGEWATGTAKETAIAVGNTVVIDQIVKFLQYLMGGIASFVVIFSGVRMITANNDEGVFTQSRKNLVEALIGLAVVILATSLITAVYGVNAGLVANGLNTVDQGNSLITLIVTTMGWFVKVIVIGISVIVMVLSGLKIAIGTEDERAKGKLHLRRSIMGFVLIITAEPILKMVYGSFTRDATGTIIGSPSYADLWVVKTNLNANLGEQIFNILTVLEKMMALIAVAVLIVGAGAAVAKIGDEAVMETVKKYVTNALIGLVIVSLSSPIIAMFFRNVSSTGVGSNYLQIEKGITELIGLTEYILAFLSIFSLGMVIYGGALVATARDDSEQVTKGRNIIINFVVGIVVIIMAWTIVETMIKG